MFDPPLNIDPRIALHPPIVPELIEGPARRVQYVVELVGPRSIPASAASQLLVEPWSGAMGNPETFCMATMDQVWQRLTGIKTGSYDSLALCWDIVSSQGLIASQAAQHLFQQLEHFGKAIGRRAIPLPIPSDLDRTGRDLLKIQDQLDIGVSVAVMARGGEVAEKDLWSICSRLGLQFSPAGSFDWRVPGFPYPLLSVTPIGSTEAFSLGSVQRGATHDGVTVGFSAPRSPAPLSALDGVFKTAEEIARAIGGIVFDDSSRQLNSQISDEMRSTLQAAVEAFDQIGIKTGSADALKLF